MVSLLSDPTITSLPAVPSMMPEPVIVARSPKQVAAGAAHPAVTMAPTSASASSPTAAARNHLAILISRKPSPPR
jgi:hypothetical protein